MGCTEGARVGEKGRGGAQAACRPAPAAAARLDDRAGGTAPLISSSPWLSRLDSGVPVTTHAWRRHRLLATTAATELELATSWASSSTTLWSGTGRNRSAVQVSGQVGDAV